MVKKFKKISWLLLGIMVFGLISMVGCTKKATEMPGAPGTTANNPSEYLTMLEEKIKAYMGDIKLAAEYDFSGVTEETKQATYDAYKKYYTNLDTELTNLKNELNSKLSHNDSKVNEANKKIVENIDNLKMSISNVQNELKANKDKLMAMPADEFVNSMKDIEKSAYDARVKLQQSIDDVKNTFK
ncbi:TPA: hypothetical protein ACOTG0_001308 [Clostridium perfringens]